MQTTSVSLSVPDPGGAPVELQAITKSFGDLTVLHHLDLSMPAGELLAVLGPSGCGKTTALRILAGFESPDSGSVLINGVDVTTKRVRDRGVGIVFQAYSLFPHMKAWENVAYGLRIRRQPRDKREAVARELLDSVGLSEHADKYPSQLSGGQQQRVALARAFAIQPSVLLLDEPLSALDAKVRVQLRSQIRTLQQERGMTTLLVTHDQEEALTMADRVAVMHGGRLEQLGTPKDVYGHPTTPFVSQFVGVVNRIPATRDGEFVQVMGHTIKATNTPKLRTSGPVVALIRPEDIEYTPDPTGAGTVAAMTLRGSTTSVLVEMPGYPAQVRIDVPTAAGQRVTIGEKVALRILRDEAVLDAAMGFPAEEDQQ